jgi:hypothetical protein
MDESTRAHRFEYDEQWQERVLIYCGSLANLHVVRLAVAKYVEVVYIEKCK